MNTTIIKGRVAIDPTLKTTENGKTVCEFSVAVPRRFQKNNQTDFFRVVAWDKKAELITNHFSKGKEILIRGVMHCDEYEKDGVARRVWKLVAEEINFCGSSSKTEAAPESPAPTPEQSEEKWLWESALELGEFSEDLYDDEDFPF